MSYRVRGMGLDRELEQKIDQKYSLEDENELVEWIVSVIMYGQGKTDFEDCDIEIPKCSGKQAFQEWLMDGNVLCDLINVLKPGSCRPQKTSHLTNTAMKKMKEMNNIMMFLNAATDFGVQNTDLFQTIDLYEARDLAQVQVTLYKLGSVAQNKQFEGPVIGVKIADKNPRKFDQNLTREGRNVIGLQMGTNQVASQKGMTPYGLGRQMITKVD